METRRFEQLSAYLDGELDAQELVEFEQWLSTQPEAQSCYRTMHGLSHNLKQQRAISPAGTCVDLERLFREARRRVIVLWSSLGGALAAACILLLPMITPVQSTADALVHRYLLEDAASINPYAVLLNDDLAHPN